MADWKEPGRTRMGFGASPGLEGSLAGRETYDVGLRKHMLSIYNYMASGILLSGVIALLMARSGAAVTLMTTPLVYVFMFAPLAIVMAMSFGQGRFSTATLQ